MGIHDDEFDYEEEYEKLTDEDWEYIFQHYEGLDKEI